MKERENGDVEEEWQMFKSAMVGCAEEVCGVRGCGGGVRKGSEWWCEEVSVAVGEKRRAECGYRGTMRCHIRDIKRREIEQNGLCMIQK